MTTEALGYPSARVVGPPTLSGRAALPRMAGCSQHYQHSPMALEAHPEAQSGVRLPLQKAMRSCGPLPRHATDRPRDAAGPLRKVRCRAYRLSVTRHVPDPGAPVVDGIGAAWRWADVLGGTPDIRAVGIQLQRGVVTPARPAEEEVGEAHVRAGARSRRLDSPEGRTRRLAHDI